MFQPTKHNWSHAIHNRLQARRAQQGRIKGSDVNLQDDEETDMVLLEDGDSEESKDGTLGANVLHAGEDTVRQETPLAELLAPDSEQNTTWREEKKGGYLSNWRSFT